MFSWCMDCLKASALAFDATAQNASTVALSNSGTLSGSTWEITVPRIVGFSSVANDSKKVATMGTDMSVIGWDAPLCEELIVIPMG